MALDTRYVPAFYFQETFRNKSTGEPLAAGILTSYKDQARAELKPLYRISGSPPNYNYDPLPNPLTLSSIGTIEDSSGNDVVAYFDTLDTDGKLELYYITVTDSGLSPQFTREGQPNLSEESLDVDDNDNFILNSQFRLFKTTTPDINTTNAVEDIYGWRFIKSNTSSVDTLTIQEFPQSVEVEGTPRYYLNYECTSAGTAETAKDLDYRITDANTFQNEPFIFSFLGNDALGRTITVYADQYFGTGGSPTTSTLVGIFDLNINFTKFSSSPVTLPSTASKTIGEGSYIQIRIIFPLNNTCNIGLTNIQLNLGDSIFEYKPN